jgi:hypothetical protein
MKTFNFDTGVRFYEVGKKHLMPGHKLSANGIEIIPFDCEDVPENATFQFASDYDLLDRYPYYIKREIFNSALISKYAYFSVNK